jgi:2-amino-4-hydroxy-6-hydroxymethyldihydropteridine diphosphokinase
MTVPAALALGSNLGDRLATLQGALDALAGTPGVEVVGASSVYETAPVGGPAQGAYLNAVVVVTTTLTPHELLAVGAAVEQRFDRVREERWGPRTLDIDVLAYGDQVVDTPDLQVPHPRAHERAFVLVPWADLEPERVVPGHGTVGELVARVGADGVAPRPDLVLQVLR